jgi:thiamine-phosphate pyrophosphorylase
MIIAVTNRLLCKDNFLERIEKICKAQPEAVILREKDLIEKNYETLAVDIKEICRKYNVNLFINSRINSAEKLEIKNIQLPFSDFIENRNNLESFNMIAVSIHSKNEAVRAEEYGASFLIAGHIFETDCKKNIPARGIKFLSEILNSVNIPVIAIGGINLSNIKKIKQTGAKGICVMSEFMTCHKPQDVVLEYKKLFVTFYHESKK